MRLILTVIFLFSLAAGQAYAMPQGCDANCKKCHTLTIQEVKNIFAKLNKGGSPAQITGVTDAPSKGLWQINILNEGQKGVLYIDYAKRNLIAGALLPIDKLLAMVPDQAAEQKQKKNLSRALKDTLLMGSPNAAKKIIVFTDPDCPFCGKLHDEMKKVIAKRQDIAFYLKLFPLKSVHPDAERKSKSIMCQKSLSLLDDAYKGRQIPDPSCKSGLISGNIKLAEELGIKAVPTLIFPDGRVKTGGLSADEIENAVN
jgi:thiol:disulfide interchange protein DsbC